MKATWNNTVIAERDTVLVEGKHKTSCPWKGQASYYSLLVNGEMLTDVAWYYADPKPEAEMVRGRVAFSKGFILYRPLTERAKSGGLQRA